MPPFVTRDNAAPGRVARTRWLIAYGWLTHRLHGAALVGLLCLVVVAGCTPAENLALSQRIHGPDKLVVSRNENTRIVDQFGGAYGRSPLCSNMPMISGASCTVSMICGAIRRVSSY